MTSMELEMDGQRSWNCIFCDTSFSSFVLLKVHCVGAKHAAQFRPFRAKVLSQQIPHKTLTEVEALLCGIPFVGNNDDLTACTSDTLITAVPCDLNDSTTVAPTEDFVVDNVGSQCPVITIDDDVSSHVPTTAGVDVNMIEIGSPCCSKDVDPVVAEVEKVEVDRGDASLATIPEEIETELQQTKRLWETKKNELLNRQIIAKIKKLKQDLSTMKNEEGGFSTDNDDVDDNELPSLSHTDCPLLSEDQIRNEIDRLFCDALSLNMYDSLQPGSEEYDCDDGLIPAVRNNAIGNVVAVTLSEGGDINEDTNRLSGIVDVEDEVALQQDDYDSDDSLRAPSFTPITYDDFDKKFGERIEKVEEQQEVADSCNDEDKDDEDYDVEDKDVEEQDEGIKESDSHRVSFQLKPQRVKSRLAIFNSPEESPKKLSISNLPKAYQQLKNSPDEVKKLSGDKKSKNKKGAVVVVSKKEKVQHPILNKSRRSKDGSADQPASSSRSSSKSPLVVQPVLSKKRSRQQKNDTLIKVVEKKRSVRSRSVSIIGSPVRKREKSGSETGGRKRYSREEKKTAPKSRKRTETKRNRSAVICGLKRKPSQSPPYVPIQVDSKISKLEATDETPLYLPESSSSSDTSTTTLSPSTYRKQGLLPTPITTALPLPNVIEPTTIWPVVDYDQLMQTIPFFPQFYTLQHQPQLQLIYQPQPLLPEIHYPFLNNDTDKDQFDNAVNIRQRDTPVIHKSKAKTPARKLVERSMSVLSRGVSKVSHRMRQRYKVQKLRDMDTETEELLKCLTFKSTKTLMQFELIKLHEQSKRPFDKLTRMKAFQIPDWYRDGRRGLGRCPYYFDANIRSKKISAFVDRENRRGRNVDEKLKGIQADLAVVHSKNFTHFFLYRSPCAEVPNMICDLFNGTRPVVDKEQLLSRNSLMLVIYRRFPETQGLGFETQIEKNKMREEEIKGVKSIIRDLVGNTINNGGDLSESLDEFKLQLYAKIQKDCFGC